MRFNKIWTEECVACAERRVYCIYSHYYSDLNSFKEISKNLAAISARLLWVPLNRSFAGILLTLIFDPNLDPNYMRILLWVCVKEASSCFLLLRAYNVGKILSPMKTKLVNPSRSIRIVEVTGSNPVCSTQGLAEVQVLFLLVLDFCKISAEKFAEWA